MRADAHHGEVEVRQREWRRRLVRVPGVEAAVARGEDELAAARALLHQCTGEAWDAVATHGAVPDRGQAMLRAATPSRL